MKTTVPLLSATVLASFLAWVSPTVPIVGRGSQVCAGSVTDGHDRGRNQGCDNSGKHFRKLELRTIKRLNKSIHQSPDDPSLYLRKAFVLSELGDFAHALANYDRAISLNPNDPHAYFYRANVRFEAGDDMGALQDYAQALSLNPNLLEVYVARAIVRSEIGDENGAIDDFNQARLLNLRDDGP